MLSLVIAILGHPRTNEHFLASSLAWVDIVQQRWPGSLEIVLVFGDDRWRSMPHVQSLLYKNEFPILFLTGRSSPATAFNTGLSKTTKGWITFWLPTQPVHDGVLNALVLGCEKADDISFIAIKDHASLKAAGLPTEFLPGFLHGWLLKFPVQRIAFCAFPRWMIDHVGAFDESEILDRAEGRDLVVRISRDFEVLFVDQVDLPISSAVAMYDLLERPGKWSNDAISRYLHRA